MRAFFFALLLTGPLLYGYTYNDLLLKAQSAIFPKILLLDKKLGEKLVDGRIVYAILYEEGDRTAAEKVRDLMRKEFKEQLGAYAFEIRLVRYSDLDAAFDATALYALNIPDGIEGIAQMAMAKGIVTFSYDIATLEHGILLSLMVEKVTVLYLNKEMLQNYPVDFVDALYQFVRFSYVR